MKDVHTIQQIAEILTKGSFSRDKWIELMSLFVIVAESVLCSLFLAIAALVPPARKMESRSSKVVIKISSKRKKAFTLAAVRHEKNLLLISVQEKTQYDGIDKRIQARHRVTDCIFQASTGNPEVTEKGSLNWQD